MPTSIKEVWSQGGYPLGRLKRAVSVADGATVFRVPIVEQGLQRLALRDMDEVTLGAETTFVQFTIEFVRERKTVPIKPGNTGQVQPSNLGGMEEIFEERKVLMVSRLREAMKHPHFEIDPDLDILIGRMVGASSSQTARDEMLAMTGTIKKLQEEILVHREVRKRQRVKIKDQEKKLKAKGELGAVSSTPIQHTPKRVIQLGD